jgi:hypothetical protein
LEQPSSSDQTTTGLPALSDKLSTALGHDLSVPQDEKGTAHQEKTSDEELADAPSSADTGMDEDEVIMEVLNARNILDIVENKEISINTPRLNHNLQRAGLDDNLLILAMPFKDIPVTEAPLGSIKGWQR